MPAKEYTVMTHDFTMNAFEAWKAARLEAGASVEKPSRFVFVSGEGANRTEKSALIFGKVKVRIHFPIQPDVY